MSDTSKHPQQDDATEPQAGGRLATARRARDISVGEIAKELHLDEPKVLALEENRFDVLGAPVFAKGHMRKYAELVGVSIDDVLADYYRLNRSAGAPPVIRPKRRVQRDHSLGPWIAAAMVIIIAAAAAWWWFNLEPGEVTAVEDPAALAPFASEQAVDETAGEEQAAIEAAAPAGDNSEDGDDGTQQPADQDADRQVDDGENMSEMTSVTDEAREVVTPPAPTVVENPLQLRLSFSGDCWTEVTDASGRRLYFDLGSAGRSVTLRGEAPLRVLLGNSNNVAVEVDGAQYPISAADRRGNTALLTINGQ